MRLIDADALLLIFASKIKKITPIGYSRDAFHHDSGRNDAWVGARIEVNKAPTIDAVPVVRCKDCRYTIDRKDGTYGCYIYLGCDFNLTDFCSYGERKE